ncbi:MAG: hypothetical protein EOO40_12730 [Deltaproteobacteria bacterium]|nr:MAG: hypothetical protein EOO40_12730 [Deltaproteobacteria bacterium]
MNVGFFGKATWARWLYLASCVACMAHCTPSGISGGSVWTPRGAFEVVADEPTLMAGAWTHLRVTALDANGMLAPS